MHRLLWEIWIQCRNGGLCHLQLKLLYRELIDQFKCIKSALLEKQTTNQRLDFMKTLTFATLSWPMSYLIIYATMDGSRMEICNMLATSIFLSLQHRHWFVSCWATSPYYISMEFSLAIWAVVYIHLMTDVIHSVSMRLQISTSTGHESSLFDSVCGFVLPEETGPKVGCSRCPALQQCFPAPPEGF